MIRQNKWEINFYFTSRGNCPVIDYLDTLSAPEKAKVDKHISLLEEFGFKLGLPQAKQLKGHSPLRELRPMPTRIIYFFHHGQRIVLLHAFKKKSNRTPSKEIDIAMNRMNEFLGRK
jgi:phage-related protein